jgi:thiamine pyrophosphokinase
MHSVNDQTPSPAEGVFFMANHRALIFVNGELVHSAALKRLIRAEDLLVAADGGARHLTRMGLMPHVVIGDLDSLSSDEVSVLRSGGVKIVRYPIEKDETDLELALLYAIEQGCQELRLVGALGGRIDQALGNIFLLGLPDLEGVDVRLEDGSDEVFLIRGSGQVEGQPGEIVSLLPLGGPARGVTTAGLQYPLRGETLWPERTRGISNVLLGERAEVQVDAGTLICVHTHERYE